ncbi:hypothetical protein OQA88_13005 [Cercophora sp. LCS_1]
MPDLIFKGLEERPNIRLHLKAWRGIKADSPISHLQALLGHLKGNANLHALDIRIVFLAPQSPTPVMHPLKSVLTSCPNIRNLMLDIEVIPSYSAERENCGLGLVVGERLPPLESLRVRNYAWRNPAPFDPEAVPEAEYWANDFDWTRLRNLHLGSRPEAQLWPLAARLISLKCLQLELGFHLDEVIQFLRSLPPTAQLEDATLLFLPEASLLPTTIRTLAIK